jgi:hypothetical protein
MELGASSSCGINLTRYVASTVLLNFVGFAHMVFGGTLVRKRCHISFVCKQSRIHSPLPFWGLYMQEQHL